MGGWGEFAQRGPRGLAQLVGLALWGRRDWVILARWLDNFAPPTPRASGPALSFRTMARADIEAVAALLPRHLTHLPRKARRAWVADMLDRGEPARVACLDGEVVAAVWLPPATDDNARLLDAAVGSPAGATFRQVVKLVTAPRCRGAGIAGSLLARGMEDLAQQGVRGMVSVIGEQNIASLKVHLRLGFGLLQVHRSRWRLGLRRIRMDRDSEICDCLGFARWTPHNSASLPVSSIDFSPSRPS